MQRSDQHAALHKGVRVRSPFMLNSSFVFKHPAVTPANFDFHCHSIVSDGLMPPQAVARRAAGNGVDLWALTDHDDTGGLVEARSTATELGMGLFRVSRSRSSGRGFPSTSSVSASTSRIRF